MLKTCTKCHKDKDLTAFKGYKERNCKHCRDCREVSNKWKKANTERLILYRQCLQDGGDWDEVKKDLNIKDFEVEPYPLDAIPCGHCNTTHPESEFNKDISNPVKKRHGCRYNCKKYDKEYREKNKDYITEKVTCQYCTLEISRCWSSEHFKICNQNPDKEDQTRSCDSCKLTFKTLKTYTNHLSSKEHQRKDYIKTNQDIIVEKLPEIVKNLKNNVQFESKFICFLCVYQFDSNELLKEHECSNLTGQINQCFSCQKNFLDAWYCRRHVLTHLNVNIMCPICNILITERKWTETHTEACVKKLLSKDYPGKSYYEKWVFKFLIMNNIEFEREKKYQDLIDKISLPYDFYLIESKILIETHGKQHYEKTNRNNADEKYEETQLHDGMKLKFTKDNNITLHVIDCRPINSYSDMEKELVKLLKIEQPVAVDNDYYIDETVLDKFGQLLGLDDYLQTPEAPYVQETQEPSAPVPPILN